MNLATYYEHHHRPHAWRWWREERPGGPPWRQVPWLEKLIVLVRYVEKRIFGYYPFTRI